MTCVFCDDVRRAGEVVAEDARLWVVLHDDWAVRGHRRMQSAIEAARNRWLGQVYRFRASIDKTVAPGERRQLAKFRGGMMFSEGCHLIDRAVALLGKPKKTSGFLHHDSPLSGDLADKFVLHPFLQKTTTGRATAQDRIRRSVA